MSAERLQLDGSKEQAMRVGSHSPPTSWSRRAGAAGQGGEDGGGKVLNLKEPVVVATAPPLHPVAPIEMKRAPNGHRPETASSKKGYAFT